MTKQSEVSLQTVKSILDKSVDKGGIFKSTDEILDAINAYNYLVSVCTQHTNLSNEVNDLKKKVENPNGIQGVIPTN